MNNAFVAACLKQGSRQTDTPFPVPFEKISDTFDLDNQNRYTADDSYDHVLQIAFGMGELYGFRKQTQVYLSEPGFKCNGAPKHSRMSDSAGVLAMKYLSLTGRKGFCLAIKPKVFAMPDISSNPLAFGLQGFVDNDETLHIHKLLLPAFDPFRRHRSVRSVPITSETLNYAETYAGLCMKQLESRSPILMLENLRTAAPENLVQALIGENVGPVSYQTLQP